MLLTEGSLKSTEYSASTSWKWQCESIKPGVTARPYQSDDARALCRRLARRVVRSGSHNLSTRNRDCLRHRIARIHCQYPAVDQKKVAARLLAEGAFGSQPDASERNNRVATEIIASGSLAS
jgi:hypothetical protein